ncbi:MAG: hypothetical protein AMXMBFR7_16510 [Planctomycetota bacterium]
MWLAICAGIALPIFVIWILSRSSNYDKLFDDAHVLWVAGQISLLKAAALEQIGTENAPLVFAVDDRRRLISDAGIAMLYTISRNDRGRYEHHASVSLAGAYTPRAIGELFVLLLANRLRIPFERLSLSVSPARVHHVEWEFDEAEQAAFVERRVETPAPDWPALFREERMRIRPRLKWKELDIRVERSN